MTILDTVARINADIAKLPAEYRTLIQAEKAWTVSHPALYALGMTAMGFLLGVLAGLAL